MRKVGLRQRLELMSWRRVVDVEGEGDMVLFGGRRVPALVVAALLLDITFAGPANALAAK